MNVNEAATILAERPHSLIRVNDTERIFPTGTYLTDKLHRSNDGNHDADGAVEVIASDDEATTARILVKRILGTCARNAVDPGQVKFMVESLANDANAGRYANGHYVESITHDGTEYVATLAPF